MTCTCKCNNPTNPYEYHWEATVKSYSAPVGVQPLVDWNKPIIFQYNGSSAELPARVISTNCADLKGLTHVLLVKNGKEEHIVKVTERGSTPKGRLFNKKTKKKHWVVVFTMAGCSTLYTRVLNSLDEIGDIPGKLVKTLQFEVEE